MEKFLNMVCAAIISVSLACSVGCRLTGNENGKEYPKKKKICMCYYLIPLKELNRKPFMLNLNPDAKNKHLEEYER